MCPWDERVEKDLEIREQAMAMRLLQRVAGVFCDALEHLDAGLRVERSAGMREMFFEQPMGGRPSPGPAAQEGTGRFEALASQAQEAQHLESMPMTLHSRDSICEAQLVSLDSGRYTQRYMLSPTSTRGTMTVDSRGPSTSGHESLVTPRSELDIPGIVTREASWTATATMQPPPAAPPGALHVIAPAVQIIIAIEETAESDFSSTTRPKNMPAVYVPMSTGCMTRTRTIGAALKGWAASRLHESCCHRHTTVASMGGMLDALFADPCNPLLSPYPEQSRRCLCINSTPRRASCGYDNPGDLTR